MSRSPLLSCADVPAGASLRTRRPAPRGIHPCPEAALLTGELKEQVDLTQVEVQFQLKLGVITLIPKSYLLPDLLAAWGAKLSGDPRPPAGEWKQSWTFQLPREIPKGDFRLYLTSYAEDDSDFADLKAHVDFRKP
ncbi:hypothetical protein [Streptomyces sp. E-08]|uniref:hypothetical protein n=1 Tax=Streptomyces sp. E-08 TaxID=3404047 RepID=UPI003CF512DE